MPRRERRLFVGIPCTPAVGIILLYLIITTWMMMIFHDNNTNLFLSDDNHSGIVLSTLHASRLMISPQPWFHKDENPTTPTRTSSSTTTAGIPPLSIYVIRDDDLGDDAAVTEGLNMTFIPSIQSIHEFVAWSRTMFSGTISPQSVPGNSSTTANDQHKDSSSAPTTTRVLSHFRAIQQAYLDGSDMVIISTNQSMFVNSNNPSTRAFRWSELSRQIDVAPFGWEALLLDIDNYQVQKHLQALTQDPWISWFTDYGSASAYVLSRNGMKQICTMIMKLISNHTTAFQPFHEWTDETTIFKNLHNVYVSRWSRSQKGLLPSPVNFLRPESILVLMSLRIDNQQDFQMELTRLKEDYHAICQYHPVCDWELNVVLTHSDLLAQWNQTMEEKTNNIGIRYHVTVTADRFNKFTFVSRFVPRMANYDRLLLKDADQRLRGFPWLSFLERSVDATITGPLREVRDESKVQFHGPNTVTYPLHHAAFWRQSSSLSSFFTTIRPLSVPFIEMYLVLIPGDFAHWFFSQTLTSHFINQSLDWGPDFQWCAAARDYRSHHPGCFLVPVVSTHEDTKQIRKSDDYVTEGIQIIDRFRENATFSRWLASGRDHWNKIIKESDLKDIKKKCRATFGMKNFDLQDCANQASQVGYSYQESTREYPRSIYSGSAVAPNIYFEFHTKLPKLGDSLTLVVSQPTLLTKISRVCTSIPPDRLGRRESSQMRGTIGI